MIMNRLFLKTLMLTLAIPFALQAQEKFEINVGISNPGMYSLTDVDLFTDENGRYEFNDVRNPKPKERQLTSFDQESYKSTLYPSISANIVYRLSESGFFKRLSLVGYLGYHKVDFENYNPVTKQSKKETARRLDYLVGVRVRMLDRPNFCIYSQAMFGKDFRNDSEYWTIANEFLRDGREEKMDFQVTYIGCQVDLGKKSHWGLFAELGHGYEYAISQIFIFPGMRGGVSYKF